MKLWYVHEMVELVGFFFSSRRRHTRFDCDWSSDVCSSDLTVLPWIEGSLGPNGSGNSHPRKTKARISRHCSPITALSHFLQTASAIESPPFLNGGKCRQTRHCGHQNDDFIRAQFPDCGSIQCRQPPHHPLHGPLRHLLAPGPGGQAGRSEEHTSELQSPCISSAVL